MRLTIEDLESLLNLSNELEESQSESIRALSSSVAQKESQLSLLSNHFTQLTTNLSDYETNTIPAFRNLVRELQDELKDARDGKEDEEKRRGDLEEKARSVLAQNAQLQKGVRRGWGREVEVGLLRGKIGELEETKQVMDIYLARLVPGYDANATTEQEEGVDGGDQGAFGLLALFHRVGVKADVIRSVVGDMHGIPNIWDSPGEETTMETLVGITELRSRLAGLSTLCWRLKTLLRAAPMEVYLALGREYASSLGIERGVDLHLDRLSGGSSGEKEFKEHECVIDVMRIQGQLEAYLHMLQPAQHVAEDGQVDLSERARGYILGLDLDLDVFGSAILLVRGTLMRVWSDPEDPDMGPNGDYDAVLQPLQTVLTHAMSAKNVVSKLQRRMDELGQGRIFNKGVVTLLEGVSSLVGDGVNFGISVWFFSFFHIL